MPGARSRLRRLLRPSADEPLEEEVDAHPTFVVGDVHGCLDALLDLLREAGLVDAALRWSGGDARLWFVGDLVDRGPDGIGVVELVSRLQREGDVHCLLGNHELLLLGVWRHPDVAAGELGETFRDLWDRNGGVARDLEQLTPDHAAWLQGLPSVWLEDRTLILHADSDMYLRYGATVEEVNTTVRAMLANDDVQAHWGLLSDATDRYAFADPFVASRVLETYGARRLVHGHTPISLILDQPPAEITEPFVYDDGRCVNVDHGLFLGGRGFVTELSGLPEPAA
jgi:calcineurin-like phosphoesterase family protein